MDSTPADGGGDARGPKYRKISYNPVKCFFCGETNNPKKMISLSGAHKSTHRQVVLSLKSSGSSESLEESSKLCPACTNVVLKQVNGCYVCGEIVSDARLRREISGGRFEFLALEERVSFQGAESKREATTTDRCCLNCSSRINTVIYEEESGNTVKMKVVLQRSKKACIVCIVTEKLTDLSRNARINIFIRTGLFVIKGSKVCSRHLVGDDLMTSLADGLIGIERQIVIDANEVPHWLNTLRTEVIRPVKLRYDDIDSFEDCDLVSLTSLTKANFHDVFSYIVSFRDTDRSMCHKVDLVSFLAKLRQGLSDDFLKAMVGYSSRAAVSAAVSRVRKALVERFVPQYLGLQAITRDELIAKHVPEYAQILYNPTPEKKAVILIIDGTYVYIPKSTNYRVLRQTFCMHKSAHLVKPIMIVTPDGWIVDIHGPYFSDCKNNDAECLRDAMKDVDGLKSYLKPADILLVDKGYDRVVNHLEDDFDLSVYMPKFLDKNKKQYTTEEANSTRLVTVSRWVVEARNGHLKSKFGFFRSTIPMQHVRHVGDLVRIGCAIINAYSKPIEMTRATVEWAEEMVKQSTKQNKLKKYIEEKKLQGQRKNWESMNGNSLPQFPRLSMEYLQKLTFGVYQIKLARSYVQDKIQNENQYNLKIHNERPGLVRVQTKSRFSGSKHRNLWVLYKEPSLKFDRELYDENDDGPILGWCCDCPNGARSLGCCAHVVSVLWYLGLARHEVKNSFPSNELISSLKDSAERPLPSVSTTSEVEHDNSSEHFERREYINVEFENGEFFFDDSDIDDEYFRDCYFSFPTEHHELDSDDYDSDN